MPKKFPCPSCLEPISRYWHPYMEVGDWLSVHDVDDCLTSVYDVGK